MARALTLSPTRKGPKGPADPGRSDLGPRSAPPYGPVSEGEVRRMRVREVMSTRLLCVKRDTPIKEIAALLARNRIGGVPAVDERGHVLGIVSESDLLPTRESVPERKSRTASDVMTNGVVSLTENATVTDAARVLYRHRINRAPVLRAGVIVGMVTRGDLLRSYLRDDPEFRSDVVGALFRGVHDITEGQMSVTAFRGVVRLDGSARDEHQGALALQVTRGVDGVVDVDDGLEVAGTRPPGPVRGNTRARSSASRGG